MAFALAIGIVLSLGVVPPLPEEKEAAIPRWELRPETIDEPGLYDLLSNAQRWPDSVAEQARGERVLDHDLLKQSPDRWRGEAFVIEGELLAYMPAVELTARGAFQRVGWDESAAWTIETGGAGQRLIILLTDPPTPPEGRPFGDQVAMVKPFPGVTTVGRFFKMTELPIDAERTAAYPVFVGKTATLADRTDAADGGDSDQRGGLSWYAAGALLLLVIGLVAALMVIRRVAKRGSGPLTRRLEEARARHEAERGRDFSNYRDDLPEDPTEALEMLAGEHEIQSTEAEGATEAQRERDAQHEPQQGGDDDAKRSG